VLPFDAGERADALEFHQKVMGEALCEGGAVEVSVPLIRVGDLAALRAGELGAVNVPAVGEAEWEQMLIGTKQWEADPEGSVLTFLVHV
jgi:hypothetical protein